MTGDAWSGWHLGVDCKGTTSQGLDDLASCMRSQFCRNTIFLWQSRQISGSDSLISSLLGHHFNSLLWDNFSVVSNILRATQSCLFFIYASVCPDVDNSSLYSPKTWIYKNINIGICYSQIIANMQPNYYYWQQTVL